MASRPDRDVDRQFMLLQLRMFDLDLYPLSFFVGLHRYIAARTFAEIGKFENPRTVIRIVEAFSARCIDALNAQIYGYGSSSSPWNDAMEACGKKKMIAIQHILVGMNIHIAWDLPITLARYVEDFRAFRKDFDRIGQLLRNEIHRCQEVLDAGSPVMHLIDHWCGRLDEAFFGASLQWMRNRAWDTATRLAKMPYNEKRLVSNKLVEEVRRVNNRIVSPPRALRALIELIRRREESPDKIARRFEQLGSPGGTT